MKRAALVLVLAACGDGVVGDTGGGPGPLQSCNVQLDVPTEMPIASPSARVNVRAVVGEGLGTLAYTWTVQRDGAPIQTTIQTADNSEIAFSAPDAGVYDVSVAVSASLVSCAAVSTSINVGVANAQSASYRIRIVPPAGVPIAPIDTVEAIPGGATYELGTLSAFGSNPTRFQINGPDGGVAAFVRITPESGSGEVDAFSDASGAALARLPTGAWDMLVVPSVDGVAPHEFFNMQVSTLTLDGNSITGVVVDPTGQPLVGAQVQITGNDVPSSVATTGNDGSFTVFSDAGANETFVVDVAPPAGSGLPRLSATSTVLVLNSMTIAYAPNLVRRDLAGLVITRGGAPLAGARVTVVGATGAAGTVLPVRKGSKAAIATGAAVIATQVSASGVLPSTPVPVAALSAVIATGAADFAVVALDPANLPTSLDAPAPAAVQTAITLAGQPVAGAIVDFLPTGALAQAAAPPVEAIADGAGLVSARLAVGGHYDVRVRDPAGAGGLTALSDVVASALPTTIALVPAIQLRGAAMFSGVGQTDLQPLAGAAVQILCTGCTGLDAERPLAEGTTDLTGRFAIAIPDPNAAPPAAAR